MMKRLLVVILLLATSLAFGIMAWDSPVRSTLYKHEYPNECAVLNVMNTQPCTIYILPAYFQQLRLDTTTYSPYWFYQSYAEIAEGLATLGGLLAFSPLSALVPKARLSLGTGVRRISFVAFLVGVIAFGSLAVIDILQEPKPPIASWAASVYKYNGGPISVREFGLLAAACLTIALVGFALHRSRLGIWKSAKDSIAYVAAPFGVFLTSGFLLFSRHTMTYHIAGFLAPLEIAGIPLVSNWFVFVVSAGIVGWALLRRLSH